MFTSKDVCICEERCKPPFGRAKEVVVGSSSSSGRGSGVVVVVVVVLVGLAEGGGGGSSGSSTFVLPSNPAKSIRVRWEEENKTRFFLTGAKKYD